MPELPEVEVAARNLRRWMTRRRVRAVHTKSGPARLFRPAAPRVFRALAGARFHAVNRIGKNLLIAFDGPDGPLGLWSHLGMTGKWVLRKPGDPAANFTRFELDLDDGSRLAYVDMRLFGRLRLVPGARFAEVPELGALGPDPLVEGIDASKLAARLARAKLPIKVAIMDQSLLPGVGNIQASEALHRAGIDPRRPARALGRAEVGKLARGVLASIRFTLRNFARTGADGGDADITYVEEDRTHNPFRVYGQAGKRCPRCKRGTITRIVQAGRSTFFCPRCQH